MIWKYELYPIGKGLLHYLITWENGNAVFNFWKLQTLLSEMLCEVLAFSDRPLTQMWFLLGSFFPFWNAFIAIGFSSIIICAKQIFPVILGTASDTETAIHIHNTLYWYLGSKSIDELENKSSATLSSDQKQIIRNMF